MKSVFHLNKSSILFLGALLLSSCGYFGAPQDTKGQTKVEPGDPNIPKDNQEPTDTESGLDPPLIPSPRRRSHRTGIPFEPTFGDPRIASNAIAARDGPNSCS